MASVDQVDFKPGGIEHLEQRDPVHTGGLHRHGRDGALAQPLHQALKIAGEGGKFLYWLSIPVRRNGDKMAGGTDVDAAGVGVAQRIGHILPDAHQNDVDREAHSFGGQHLVQAFSVKALSMDEKAA